MEDRKKNLGVEVEFKNCTRPKEKYRGITNVNWGVNFVHLEIEIKPAEYNKKDEIIKVAEVDCVASFTQDEVFAIRDYL